MTRGSLVLAVAAALAIFATLTMLRGFQPEPPQAPVAQTLPPRYQLQGVEWTRLDAQGRPLIEATAATARYYDDKSARFETLQVRRLGAAGGPWNLTAPQGLMPPGEERIQLTDPVEMTGKLKNGDPLRVTAETLWVDLQRKEIHTADRVLLTAPNRQARARGLRADWAGTRVQLLNEVEVDYVAQPRG